MGPRKVHKLKLGKYLFIREFLTKEWSVAEEERGNVDTYDNASIDAVWDSFQHFLELNGYAPDFCSKILLGKLLHEAGVEKVKRGPRRRQKFYYFPLRPVKGSKAQAILASNSDARYDASTTSYRLKKVKPEYYTLSTQSLGRVSVGVLHDRSMSPEKYATKVLRRSLRRRTIKNGYCESNLKSADDKRSPSNWLADSAGRNDIEGEDSGFHTYAEELNVSRLQNLELERRPQDYNRSHERNNYPFYDARHHASGDFHSEERGSDESNFSSLLAQSLSRLYDIDEFRNESQGQEQNHDHINWEKENQLRAKYEDHCMKRFSYRSTKNTSFQMDNFAPGASGGGFSLHEFANGNLVNYDEEFSPTTSRVLTSSRMTQFMFYGGHSEKFNGTAQNEKCYSNGWGVIPEPPHLSRPSTTAESGSDVYFSHEYSFPQHKQDQNPEQHKQNLNENNNCNNLMKKTSRKRKGGEPKREHYGKSGQNTGNSKLLVIGDVYENTDKAEYAEKSFAVPATFKRPRGRPKGSKNKKKISENISSNEKDFKSSQLTKKAAKKPKRLHKSDSNQAHSFENKTLLENDGELNPSYTEKLAARNMPMKIENRPGPSVYLSQKTGKDPFVLDVSYRTEGFAKGETILGIDYCNQTSLLSPGNDMTHSCAQPLSSSPGITYRELKSHSRAYEEVPLATSDNLDRAAQTGTALTSAAMLCSSAWGTSITLT